MSASGGGGAGCEASGIMNTRALSPSRSALTASEALVGLWFRVVSLADFGNAAEGVGAASGRVEDKDGDRPGTPKLRDCCEDEEGYGGAVAGVSLSVARTSGRAKRGREACTSSVGMAGRDRSSG